MPGRSSIVAVICTETAHINTDQNGAPERVGAIKLQTVPTPDGKLTPELIDWTVPGWWTPRVRTAAPRRRETDDGFDQEKLHTGVQA